MNEIQLGDAPPRRALHPLIDFYRLDALEAVWTLVALLEGNHERLLLTGTARLPLSKKGDPLRCTFVDAPSPVLLDGKQGTLRVRTSTLELFGRELGLVSIVGAVDTEWTCGTTTRPFAIALDLEARFRI